MNAPTKLFAIIISATLSACVTVPTNGTRPYADSPDPVIDSSKMDAHKLGMYEADKLTCRRLQESAMPFNFLEEFGASDVMAHKRAKEAKASAIMRQCLSNRGYAILY